MPNWTSNEVVVSAKKPILAEIKEKVKGDRAFDFNKIIPMPDDLNIEQSSELDYGVVLYLTDKLNKEIKDIDVNNVNILKALVHNMFNANWPEEMYNRCKDLPDSKKDELYKKGKQYINNYMLYGFPTWYGWCINNWGTKWNACDVSVLEDGDNLVYMFDTAWDIPTPVLRKLSEEYPDAKFIHTYRFEDDFESVFEDIWKGGKIV